MPEGIVALSAPNDRTIVLNLRRGAVPERASEISAHWSSYRPDVEVVPSTAGVIMEANRHRIRFDTKTFRDRGTVASRRCARTPP